MRRKAQALIDIYGEKILKNAASDTIGFNENINFENIDIALALLALYESLYAKEALLLTLGQKENAYKAGIDLVKMYLRFGDYYDIKKAILCFSNTYASFTEEALSIYDDKIQGLYFQNQLFKLPRGVCHKLFYGELIRHFEICENI
jgi:hypothetical protein